MKKTSKKFLIPLILVILGILAGSLAIAGVQTVNSRKAFVNSSGVFFANMEKVLAERAAVLEETGDYDQRINGELVFSIGFLFDADKIGKKDSVTISRYQKKISELNEKAGFSSLYIIDREGKILISSDLISAGSNLKDLYSIDPVDLENVAAEIIDSYEEDVKRIHPKDPEDENKTLYFSEVEATGDYEDLMVVGVADNEIMTQVRKDSSDLSMFFEPLVPYDEISGFAADAESGIVLNTSGDLSGLQGCSLEELGIHIGDLPADGSVFKLRLPGGNCLASMKRFTVENLGDWVVFCTEPTESYSRYNAIAWIVFVLAVIFILAYFSMNSFRGNGKAKMRRNAFISTMTAVLAVVIAVEYLGSMASASMAMEQINVNADAFVKSYRANKDLDSSLRGYYEKRSLTLLDTLVSFIEDYEEQYLYFDSDCEYYSSRSEDGTRTAVNDLFGNRLAGKPNDEMLQSLCLETEAENMYIINGDGRTISTSSSDWYYDLATGEKGHEDSLRDVLDHRKESFYLLEEDGENDRVAEIYALPIRLFMKKNEEGNTEFISLKQYEDAVKDETPGVVCDNGLLYVESSKPLSIFRSSAVTAQNTLESIRTAQMSGLALVDTENMTVVCSTENLADADVTALGFADTYKGIKSYRFVKLNGEKVFAGIVPLQEDRALITVLDRSDVMGDLGALDLAAGLAVCFFMILLCGWFVRTEPQEAEEGEDDRFEKLIRPQMHSSVGSIREWFALMKPQKRAMLFVKCSVLAIFLNTVIRALLIEGGSTSDLAFRYVLSENWEKGLHLFSITFAFHICLAVFCVLSLAKTLVKYLVPMLGSGTETMVRLVLSILEYAGVIVLIFYNLYLFGVQMGTVLTSASIMALVIGLGANSLIGDVLAGLFIIVEQEYKVGDIVTIDGFTGFVRSIGLRTTKIQDFSGNIKTFNNAKISGVLNLTDNYTTIFVTMNISANVPVDVVEKLVENDLKESLKDDPDLVAGPWFSGIPEVKATSYSISIGASSLQQKSWSLRKKIIQKMLMLLKEKNIPMS